MAYSCENDILQSGHRTLHYNNGHKDLFILSKIKTIFFVKLIRLKPTPAGPSLVISLMLCRLSYWAMRCEQLFE